MISSKFFSKKEEITALFPAAASLELPDLVPYLFRIEQKVTKKLLGAAQYEVLAFAYEAFVASNYDLNLLDNWEKELLMRVQMMELNLAIRQYIPFVTAQIGSSGVNAKNGEVKVASEPILIRILEEAQAQGYEVLELILEWLDENREHYPDWAESEAFTEANAMYLNTAAEFTRFFNIGGNRYTFLCLLPQRREAERIVDRVIWELGPVLKAEAQAKNLTPANEKLLELVKEAVANLTMGDGLLAMSFEVSDYGVTVSANSNQENSRVKTPVGDPRLVQLQAQARQKGASALELIKDLIYANIDDYPAFRDGAHYTPAAPAPAPFVNESTAKIGIL